MNEVGHTSAEGHTSPSLILSSAQRSLWSSQRRNPTSPLQNMALLTSFEALVDPDRLSAAFASVVAASDTLRLRIDGDVPSLIDTPPLSQRIEIARSKIEAWAEDRIVSPIDMSVCGYDSVILVHEDDTVSWYLGLHHVLTDATSSALVHAATARAYAGENLDDVLSYNAWAAGIEDRTDRRRTKAMAHWSARVPAPVLADLYRPVRQRTAANRRVPVGVDDALMERISHRLETDYRLVSEDLGWTAFLMSAASILISRVTGAERFSIGMPVHNRRAADARSLIGPVMEVYPVDVAVDKGDTFRSLHKRIAKQVMTSASHAHPGIGASAADVSAIVNVIRSSGLGDFDGGASRTSWIHPGAADPNHLLGLQLTTYGSVEPQLFLDLNEAAASEVHHRTARGHLWAVLDAMVSDPDASIGSFELTDPLERVRIDAWGSGPPALERPPTILHRLADTLALNHRPALEFEGQTWTGEELWAWAGSLATDLRHRGVAPGDRVALNVHRRAASVAALLGILRAGASYVPLDPTHPDIRRQRLIERAGCTLTLTDDDLAARGASAQQPETDLPEIHPENEAYVLFTSGSTGEAKGVPITHAGLADYLAFAVESYVGDEPPVAPLFSALTFDLTVTSLFVPLLTDGRLVVIEPDGPAGLREVARRTDLTWAKATPSHLEILLRMMPERHDLRTLVVGGEAFSIGLAERLRSFLPGVRLFNEYGPTEAVVGCMIAEYDGRASWRASETDVPIGRPAPGVDLRILDAHGRVAPIGASGELVISSPGLTAGYLGGAGADAFVTIEGKRAYRSGDLVRLVDDQTATYLGRIDEQIKIGGIRLDPAEVSQALEEHPLVHRAAVRLWNAAPADGDNWDDGDGESSEVLAAWVESTDPHADELSPNALRQYLALRLASHQLPAAYASVEALPTTRNGKLDIARLPEPNRVRAASSASASSGPQSETERMVCEIWAGIFVGHDAIGLDDDFFAMGGDSLGALEMAAALGEALDRTISDDLPFLASTPRELAGLIDASILVDRSAGPTPRPAGSPPPQSARERAMLFEHRAQPGSCRYNIGRHYTVEQRSEDSPVDMDRLDRAIRAVALRHEPLHWTHSAPRRQLSAAEAVEIRRAAAPLARSQASARATALYRETFDLDDGPLMRVELQPIDDGGLGVVVACHHVSGDAGSLDRWWADVEAHYVADEAKSQPPAPLPFGYGDHATWQEANLQEESNYWRELWAEGAHTHLGLEPPAIAQPDGYIEQPSSVTAAALTRATGQTVTAVALAGVSELMQRAFNDDRAVSVGITASVRDHVDVDDHVGYFLNTLPLVLEPAPDATIERAVRSAAASIGAALGQRRLPFGRMVFEAQRHDRPVPEPRVLLAVEDLAPASLGQRVAHHRILASGQSIADATFFVQRRGDNLELGIEWSGSVMTSAQARRLLDDLDAFLAAATDDAQATKRSVALPSITDGELTGGDGVASEVLIDRILRHASTEPGAPAVLCGHDTLTWAELDRRSASIGQALLAHGAGPGRRVLVALDRSTDAVASILAVLRTGAAYVPIDTSYPEDRMRRIAEASGAILALAGPGLTEAMVGAPVLDPSSSDALSIDRATSPWPEVGVDDEAYVIFTSGSTGVPKGVPVSHGHLATSTLVRTSVYRADPKRFLMLSSVGFDSSIVGLFWTLCTGGAVVLPEESEAHDPDALLALIDRQEPTDTLLVPSLYLGLLERGRGVNHWPGTVIVAGEACSPQLVERHHALRPASRLYNEYGPTECSVWASVHRCEPQRDGQPLPYGTISIGRPIPGAGLRVVDSAGRQLPAGVPGELMITGDGVVGRYLSASTADQRRFGRDTDGVPTYRTGDRCVIEQGLAWFLGRVDDQLNVGGLRVEPEEIERALESALGVRAAVVVAANVGGRDRLVAHLEVGDDADHSAVTAAARSSAEASVAPAAVPSRYVIHDELPRTPHGKLDRSAAASLSVPEGVADLSSPIPRPGSGTTSAATERRVLEAFRAELGRPELGLDDDFFAAGGDSLAALTLAMRLEDDLGAEVSVTSLLRQPTARAMAAQVGTASLQLSTSASSDAQETGPELDLGLIEWIRTAEADQPVLVMLAPGSGHLLGYRAMIDALDPKIAILGVRLPGHDGKRQPSRSIEEQALAVRPAIEASLEGRTFVLFGGSSGGLLAWELGARLEADGRPAAGIIMQDTVHPTMFGTHARPTGVAKYRERLEADGILKTIKLLIWRVHRRGFNAVQRKLLAKKEAKGSAELSVHQIAQRLFAVADEITVKYEPPRLKVPVVFFAASTTNPDETHHVWQTQADDLTVHVFEGDHSGLNSIGSAGRVGAAAAVLEAEFASATSVVD